MFKDIGINLLGLKNLKSTNYQKYSAEFLKLSQKDKYAIYYDNCYLSYSLLIATNFDLTIYFILAKH